MDDRSGYRTTPNIGPRDGAHRVAAPAPVMPRSLDISLSFLQPPQQADELGRLGHYRVLNVLGRGAMGMVLRAEDSRLGRDVALKVILPWLAEDETLQTRFLREARALAAIAHDNVIAIYEVGKEPVPFLAMPLLEGELLSARLDREGRLPMVEVARIGRDIAAGLAAVHETGLVHRDVKPSNIWLQAPRTRVKLLDFGLVRGGGGSAVVTESGAVIGTPAYMSPEQARGEPADARSDLFSLGCVLYQMATGELPFGGDTALAALWAVVTHSPLRPETLNPEVPTALSALIRRLLAKPPHNRPNSAREAHAELRILRRSLSTAPAAATAPEPEESASSPGAPEPGWSREGIDLAADLEQFLNYRKSFSSSASLQRMDSSALARWIEAAERGSAIGEFLTAACLAEGVGIKADLRRAIELYRKAAERGFAPAQYALGDCCWNGIGVWRDEVEAFRWYRLAAIQGDANAQARIGACYLYGFGVPKDEAEGVKWYRLAAEQGLAIAQNGLAQCCLFGLGIPKEPAEAVRWYRKAAGQGHAIAQFHLGTCYLNGIGVAAHKAEAVRWLRRAAEQGDVNAQCSLAQCCQHGIGTALDREEAVRWYRKAAAQGDASAKEALRQMSG